MKARVPVPPDSPVVSVSKNSRLSVRNASMRANVPSTCDGPSTPIGQASASELESLRYYISSIMLCESLETVGTAWGNPSGCLTLYQATTMQDYDERRIAAAKKTIFATGCNSWYLDADGVPSTWPWSYDAFAEQTARPRLPEFDRVA